MWYISAIFFSQITLVIDDLNYEKRIGKENKVKQYCDSVKKKKLELAK